VEFSRKLYRKADLNVAPKPKLADRQLIEAFIRGRGLDPRAFSEKKTRTRVLGNQHRIDTGEMEQWELRTLTEAFAQSVLNTSNGIPPIASARLGSPGGDSRWSSKGPV